MLKAKASNCKICCIPFLHPYLHHLNFAFRVVGGQVLEVVYSEAVLAPGRQVLLQILSEGSRAAAGSRSRNIYTLGLGSNPPECQLVAH